MFIATLPLFRINKITFMEISSYFINLSLIKNYILYFPYKKVYQENNAWSLSFFCENDSEMTGED